MTTIARTAIVDDDGSLTTGTIWNNTWKQELYNQIDAALATLDAKLFDTNPTGLTTTGTVNNWAPGLNGHTFTRWSGAGDLTVTGLAGGVSGQRWLFRNGGSSYAYFPHQSASSLSANRFTNIVTSMATVVAPGGSAVWEYNGGLWALVAHVQGAPAPYTPVWSGSGTPPAIGNGTISGQFMLVGKLVYYELHLITGSTSTYGVTGPYSFSVPGTPVVGYPGQNHQWTAQDVSAGGVIYAGLGSLGIFSVTQVTPIYTSTVTAAQVVGVAPTTPITWATGDIINMSGVYMVG